jgi:tetratricopeptide (TPR) repeat protein
MENNWDDQNGDFETDFGFPDESEDDEIVTADEAEVLVADLRAQGEIDEEADLRGELVQWYLESGDPARALPHCRRLIEFWTEAEGSEADTTMVWRGFLGRALTENGAYLDAEEVLGELLVDRTRVLGPDHDSTLVTRGNLARAVGRGGRPHEAILIAEQLLADRLRLLGPDHPSTLDTRGHLAQFHVATGDIEVALMMMRQLLSDRERLLDADDPVLSSTRHNLAVFTAEQINDDADAIEVLLDNAEQQIAALGELSEGAFRARSEVIQRLMVAEMHETALQWLTDLVADRTYVQGPFATGTISAQRRWGNCLLALGRADEAVRHLRGVTAAAAAVLGDTADDTIACRMALVTALAEEDMVDEVAPVLISLLEATRHLSPDDSQRSWVDEVAAEWL